MSKEAEEYLRKSNNRPTITFVNGLIGEPSFTISKTLELMQSYHEAQLKAKMPSSFELQEIVTKIAYQQLEEDQVDDLFSKMGLLNEWLKQQILKQQILKQQILK